jgi:anthranilate/para-aminobenzoate synthase component I
MSGAPLQPTIVEFRSDGFDPVAALRALGLEGRAPVILLDSAGGSADLARYHYLAWQPLLRLTAKDGAVYAAYDASLAAPAEAGAADAAGGAREPGGVAVGEPFAAVRAALAHAGAALAAAPFAEARALFGLFSYDAVRSLERLPDTTRDDLGVPDVDVFLPARLVRFDMQTGDGVLVCWGASVDRAQTEGEAGRLLAALQSAPPGRPAKPPEIDFPVFRSNFTRGDYAAVVARTREYVFAGDIFQANLSQRLDLLYSKPSLELYEALRTVNPSPFAGYMNMGDYELISSSPERLVSLDADGWAQTRPIAGTRPRGAGADDASMAGELNLDPKEQAEHIMLVDLERNDLGKVCDYGTVRVSELMVNEYYSHVIHIVSNVRGRLHAGRDSVDLLKAMFPGGTITGCPKVRCMEIIDELETVRRGAYTGSFGWIAGDGLDMNIIIRTLVRVGDRLYLQVGGGIVADSDPQREYDETLHKARGMLRATTASIGERRG